MPSGWRPPAMIATPLLPPGRRRLAAVGGRHRAGRRHHRRRQSPLGPAPTRRAALCATAAATVAVEKVGTTTGVPFGRYRYTGALRPAVRRRPGDRAAGLVRHGRAGPRGGPRRPRSTIDRRPRGSRSAPRASPPGTCSSTRRWSARATGAGPGRAGTAASRSTNFLGWFVTGPGADGRPRAAPAAASDLAPHRHALGRAVRLDGGHGDAGLRRLLPTTRLVAVVGGVGMLPWPPRRVRRTWPRRPGSGRGPDG